MQNNLARIFIEIHDARDTKNHYQKIKCWNVILGDCMVFSKRAEYCFESTVSEKKTHWASLSFGANSVSSAKNSVSSFWHTNNRLKGTHWVRSPELSEPQKTHWVRCLKPYSPKPYSARFMVFVVYQELLNDLHMEGFSGTIDAYLAAPKSFTCSIVRFLMVLLLGHV